MPAWLKHAFAVDPPGPAKPSEQEAALIDRLARAVARRGMETPAIVALECSQNLNFLASQALVFFAPILQLIFNRTEYETVIRFLERRGSIEYITRRIEAVADPQPDGPTRAVRPESSLAKDDAQCTDA